MDQAACKAVVRFNKADNKTSENRIVACLFNGQISRRQISSGDRIFPSATTAVPVSLEWVPCCVPTLPFQAFPLMVL
jgi:hypothetical protein